jgi:hypothetical protein
LNERRVNGEKGRKGFLKQREGNINTPTLPGIVVFLLTCFSLPLQHHWKKGSNSTSARRRRTEPHSWNRCHSSSSTLPITAALPTSFLSSSSSSHPALHHWKKRQHLHLHKAAVEREEQR